LQSLLDDVHAQFISAVAVGRKLDQAQVVRFADGRIVSGAQAKDLKMIDALGGLEGRSERRRRPRRGFHGLPGSSGRAQAIDHGSSPQPARPPGLDRISPLSS